MRRFGKGLLAFGVLAVLLVACDAAVSQLEFPETVWPRAPAEYLKPLFCQPTTMSSHPIKQFLWASGLTIPSARRFSRNRTLYIGAVAFVLAIIAWIKRRQLRHPELADIASYGGGRICAFPWESSCTGWEDRWFPAPIFADHLPPYQHAYGLPASLLLVPFSAVLFQNAGNDAFRAVHADIFEPDGGWGLPADEIVILQG